MGFLILFIGPIIILVAKLVCVVSVNVSVLRDHEWKELQWRHVVVGDIIRVLDQQSFPADLLLLSSR